MQRTAKHTWKRDTRNKKTYRGRKFQRRRRKPRGKKAIRTISLHKRQDKTKQKIKGGNRFW